MKSSIIKHKGNFFLGLVALIGMTLTSCESEIDVKNNYFSEKDQAILNQYYKNFELVNDYELTYPSYLLRTVPDINNQLANLGRVMFYDKNLSADKKISCASCHKQEIAFSDDVALSNGIENRVTDRNSIALGSSLNFAAYYGTPIGGVPFFWDNRAGTIQEQSEQTFQNKKEMGMDMSKLVGIVNSQPYYRVLIDKFYYPGKNLSKEEILDAVAEFTNSITHLDAKFDKAMEQNFKSNGSVGGQLPTNLSGFTQSENAGYNIYKQKCASCHGMSVGAPGKTAANNGLAMTYSDFGSGNNNLTTLFKVPTLRNILNTGPYMHDGSLATIGDVLDHYSQGIKNHPGLSYELKQQGQPVKMNFSDQDRKDLLAFFETLNDNTTATMEKFSNPFK